MVCYKNIVYGPSANATVPDANLNAIIPTTGKPKLRIQAVYADDGVSIAYYEYSLVVDTIIYVQNALDVEAEARRLQSILLTPGYTLVYYPVGLGLQEPILGPKSLIPTGIQDIKGGPYPQECNVEPIASNNAILLNWSVMFRRTSCTGLPEIVQFNSELDFDVDDEGDLVFNLRVTYQKAVPIKDISELSPLVNALVHNADTSYVGMRRRKRTSLSRDQRLAMIHIEYRTIKSDNALFPFTHNIEANDHLASELMPKGAMQPGGFMSWSRKVSAVITLPARVHKSYAWLVYLKILRERFRNLHQLSKLANVLGTDPPAGQANAEKDKNFFILLGISINDSIYSRSVTFETTYLVVTDLPTLFEKTKILHRVNTLFDDDPDPPDPATPKTLTEQWKAWALTTNSSLNGRYEHEPANVPVIFDQCSAYSTYPKIGSTVLAPLELEEETEEETPERYEDEKYSWLKYENNFYIEEEAKNIHVSYLQNVPNSTYVTSPEDAASTSARAVKGMTLNGTVYPTSPELPPKTINRAPPSFKLRMKGQATRVGFPIPIPVVCSVAGEPAVRSGKPRVKQRQISQGDVPVYHATWDIVYDLNKDPYATDIMKQIVSSGDPAQFS